MSELERLKDSIRAKLIKNLVYVTNRGGSYRLTSRGSTSETITVSQTEVLFSGNDGETKFRTHEPPVYERDADKKTILVSAKPDPATYYLGLQTELDERITRQITDHVNFWTE